MGLHINEIRELYDNGHYTYKSEEVIPSKFMPDHVFDENLSVKRNREMVVEHNKRVDELKLAKSTKQAELNKKLTEAVVEYIKEYYELTDRQARIVEGFTYREHHSFMCDYFSYIDTFAEFADILVNQVED
jgi:hypothetical protein